MKNFFLVSLLVAPLALVACSNEASRPEPEKTATIGEALRTIPAAPATEQATGVSQWTLATDASGITLYGIDATGARVSRLLVRAEANGARSVHFSDLRTQEKGSITLGENGARIGGEMPAFAASWAGFLKRDFTAFRAATRAPSTGLSTQTVVPGSYCSIDWEQVFSWVLNELTGEWEQSVEWVPVIRCQDPCYGAADACAAVCPGGQTWSIRPSDCGCDCLSPYTW